MSRRTHVILPINVVAEIDRLVGKRGRRAFLTELAQREVLTEIAGAWQAEDHPELADGAEAWVRGIRAIDSGRFEELERHRDGKWPT